MKKCVLIASLGVLLASLSCQLSKSNPRSTSNSSQASPTPKTDASAEKIAYYKSLLFADQSLDEVAGFFEQVDLDSDTDPGSLFISASAAVRQGNVPEAKEKLKRILAIREGDSRLGLWAWKALRDLGERPPTNVADKVQGVVIELNTRAGAVTVSAYSDGRARLINAQGEVTLREPTGSDPKISTLINDLLKSIEPFVKTAPLSEKHKTPDPEMDYVRASILTLRGIHTIGAFAREIDKQHPLGPVLLATLNLVTALSK